MLPESLIVVGGALAVVLVSAGAWLAAKRSGLFRSEHSVGSTDEDADAFGQEVKVLEAVSDTQIGRIQHLGTSWPARTTRGRIEAGQLARLVDRDNLVWIVEPAAPQKLTS